MRPLDTQLDAAPDRAGRLQHRRSRGLAALGMATSLVLHGAIATIIVWATLHGGKDIQDAIKPKMLEFEDVELLALGEKKPPNQLPRIANPAPPAVKEDAVNLAKPHDKPPEPKEKDDEEKPEKREKPDHKRRKMLDKLSELNNPNRPSNTDIPEGRQNGVVGGSKSDAALSNMMKTYVAKLMAAIVKYWNIPTTFDDAEIKRLAGKVVVKVRLNDQGKITGYDFLAKTGNPAFDGSVERVLRKFQGSRSLPLPSDPDVRGAVLDRGLDLKKWDALGGR